MFRSRYFQARYFAARLFGSSQDPVPVSTERISRIAVVMGRASPAVELGTSAATVVTTTRPPAVELHSNAD